MKKLLLLVAIVASGFTANAQEKNTAANAVEEGAWWIAGTGLKFADNDASTTFGVKAAVGTFVTEDVTLGLGLGIENVSYEAEGMNSETGINVTPLARKYWSVNDKFFFFAQADVPLTFYDGGFDYGVNLRPGVDYFVAKNFTIEATFGQVGYNGNSPEEGEGEGNFGIDIDSSSLMFGLKYFF